MTFLRVGSLVPTQWEEINWKKNLWTIPGSPDEDKKGSPGSANTNQIQDVLDRLHELSEW